MCLHDKRAGVSFFTFFPTGYDRAAMIREIGPQPVLYLSNAYFGHYWANEANVAEIGTNAQNATDDRPVHGPTWADVKSPCFSFRLEQNEVLLRFHDRIFVTYSVTEGNSVTLGGKIA